MCDVRRVQRNLRIVLAVRGRQRGDELALIRRRVACMPSVRRLIVRTAAQCVVWSLPRFGRVITLLCCSNPLPAASWDSWTLRSTPLDGNPCNWREQRLEAHATHMFSLWFITRLAVSACRSRSAGVRRKIEFSFSSRLRCSDQLPISVLPPNVVITLRRKQEKQGIGKR